MKKKIKRLIVLFLSFSLVIACQCSRYARSDANNPFFRDRTGYLFDICKGKECGLVLPNMEKYYIDEYKLPNDSTVRGYWAGVSIHDLKDNSAYSITVGKGSEFWAGKCKFRVLEVNPILHWNEDSTDLIAPHVKFQLLALPKFCPCANKKLKKFDVDVDEKKKAS